MGADGWPGPQVGERGVTYSMNDRDCIGRECFAPGRYESRGATMSGSRNTGNYTNECMTRAYHGCPSRDASGNCLRPIRR